MEYDNNRPFSSEGAAQERKRKHALGKGVIIGVVATLLVVILALSCVFMGLIRSGNIHIGIDGRIYVQDVGTSDNEGIGTKVEGKLNALDSLLGCFRRIGHYFLVFFREKKEIPGFLWQCWPQFGILRLYGVEPAAWLRPKTRAAARRGHASAGGVPRRRTTCTNPPTRPSRTGAPCGRP